MAATEGGPAGLSRRQIMASGALATIAVLAGDRARAAASPVRHRRAQAAPPTAAADHDAGFDHRAGPVPAAAVHPGHGGPR